jgi:hypothetical protein
MPNFDMAMLLKLMNDANAPLMAKLEKIEDRLAKVAMRDDLAQVRSEALARIDQVEKNADTTFMPRDLYNTRHDQLIEHLLRVETALNQGGQQAVQWQQSQEGRLQAAKREIDDRFAEVYKVMDARFKDEKKQSLSAQDRRLVHWTQIIGAAGIIVSILGVILQHVSFR